MCVSLGRGLETPVDLTHKLTQINLGTLQSDVSSYVKRREFEEVMILIRLGTLVMYIVISHTFTTCNKLAYMWTNANGVKSIMMRTDVNRKSS